MCHRGASQLNSTVQCAFTSSNKNNWPRPKLSLFSESHRNNSVVSGEFDKNGRKSVDLLRMRTIICCAQQTNIEIKTMHLLRFIFRWKSAVWVLWIDYRVSNCRKWIVCGFINAVDEVLLEISSKFESNCLQSCVNEIAKVVMFSKVKMNGEKWEMMCVFLNWYNPIDVWLCVCVSLWIIVVICVFDPSHSVE